MKKNFLKRVIREGTVDTREYRYIVRERNNGAAIYRLPLEWLDTTAAIDGWELVKEL